MLTYIDAINTCFSIRNCSVGIHSNPTCIHLILLMSTQTQKLIRWSGVSLEQTDIVSLNVAS